jgi:hypothetical protein
MPFTFQLRRDYGWRWTRDNPILADGEPGVERETHKVKLGDGETPWNDLPYSAGEGGGDANIVEHINDPTPHPVYDDGPSLQLIYENAKV